MRLPRWRFRLRGLMVAIAAAATALWVGLEVSRLGAASEGYRRVAEHLAREEAFARELSETYRGMAASWRQMFALGVPPLDSRATAAEREAREVGDTCQASVDYHAAMRAKYERAARYPWLPVAPDPPEQDLLPALARQAEARRRASAELEEETRALQAKLAAGEAQDEARRRALAEEIRQYREEEARKKSGSK